MLASRLGRPRGCHHDGCRADACGDVPAVAVAATGTHARLLSGPSRPASYSCPFRSDELRERVLVVGHGYAVDPAVQPAHLVSGVLCRGPPAVVVEPVDDDCAILVVVDQ